MPDTPIGEQELQDPLGKRYWPLPRGRDPERTPMLWTDAIGAGFTDPQVRPWLPIGNARIRNVADQRHDSSSILCFVRDVIALRRTSSDLQGGAYRQLRSPDGVWAWQRGQGTTVVLNLSDRRIRLPQTTGTILIATAREREAQRVDGGLELGPWEGAVCSSGST
ncbi:MAG TPA: DUF3459 domain-containing protein [Candidatus Dormibacteraeota bacterium]|nr:DUF3459 domain-containing protein [Candidatus Dormibacteraeota bacterium]